MSDELPLVPAKSLLHATKYGDGWFGTSYTLNLYRGCSHGCIYCDSRSDCYQVRDFDTVHAKKDALSLLERELSGKRVRGVVGMGAMSDPYNPREAQALLTRGALGLLDRYGFGAHIVTKSDLVARDIDVLCSVRLHDPVSVGLTITCAEDALSLKIEPNAPASSRRLRALRELSRAGLYAGALMMPVLPFINDDERQITALIDAVADAGGKFIAGSMGVTQRAGQREYFHGQLERLFPGMAARYRAAFGMGYECESPNAKGLWQAFTHRCTQRGLAFHMADIARGARENVGAQQMRWF